MYYGLQHMVEYAQSKGYNICDLAGADCTKDNIYEKLTLLDPIFFFGMGHGSPTKYTDDNEEAVWICGNTSCPLPPNNLRSRIVYLWSCLTARELGHKIIERGGWSYAGFTEEWVWIAEGEIEGDPYDDRYAKGFFESGNELIKALLDEKTMQEAVQASINKYNEWIDYWKESDDLYASECIKWLAWDRDALTLIGSPEASLVVSAPIEVTQDSRFFADVYMFNDAGQAIVKDLMVAFGNYNSKTNIFSIAWRYIGKSILVPPDNSCVTFDCIAEQVGTWDVLVAVGTYDGGTDTFTIESSMIKEDVLTVTEKSV